MTTNMPAKRQHHTEHEWFEPDEPAPTAPRLFTSRGRHRKPRPRKALLAAGGLAVAAGALSLVRLVPGSDTGGIGTVEAEPHPDPAATTERATDAATTVAAPKVSPSTPSALGSLTPATATAGAHPASPESATTTGRTPKSAAPAAPGATTTPDTPNAQAPAAPGTTPRAPQAPRPTTPAPAPSRTAPAPASPEPAEPGVCVPVIGLCVDTSDQRD